MTVLLALAAALAALAWALWPLLDKTPAPILVEDDRLGDLIARKEAVIAAIRDLEFDYRVGKLTEEDYQRYDQRLRRQAIVFMQQIEQIAPASTEMDQSIETEIASLRRVQDGGALASSVAAQVAAAPAVASTVSPLASAGAQTTPRSNGASPRFCTNCGQPLQPQHRFCANCGTPVASH